MTKRKAAAQKAHSTYRKSAPKAAAKKARGTYRKTSAQFEEFVRDAQMPESMRTLAEKSVVQTRELCEHSLEAVLESWERLVDAGQGAVALNRKAIDIAADVRRGTLRRDIDRYNLALFRTSSPNACNVN